MKKLNNWYITGNVPNETDPWQAPEAQLPKVSMGGWVQNHPEFKDGDHITCSAVVGVTKVIDTLFATTLSGSIYELEEVEPTYAKMFPNAKERLYNMFNKEKQ